MSVFDWLQIVLGFIHVVRRAIARAALLLPGKTRASKAESTELQTQTEAEAEAS